MRRIHLIIALVIAISLTGFAKPRQTKPLLPDYPQVKSATEFEAHRAVGLAALYNLDYPTAEAEFEKMIKLNPEHPAGYHYLATTRWLSILKATRRLQIGLYTDDAFFAGSTGKLDPQLEGSVREAINKAIRLANACVTKNKNDVEGLYYLGAAHGTMAGFEFTVTRRFVEAARKADKGVEFHTRVTRLDPNFADADLMIGLYKYAVAKLPILQKVPLVMVGKRGNSKDGIKRLLRAMEQGKLVADDARTLLVAIYEREKNYSEAFKLLDELTGKYPKNYLFSLERAVVLSQLGKSCESYTAFRQVLKDENAQAVADLIHYRYGEALLKGGEFKGAAEYFLKATKSPQSDSALVSLAYLRRGQALDALQDRAQALDHYRTVLERENAFDSHNQARRYRDNPYAREEVREEKCLPGN
ncbi:MAG TPA: tetratricopeptide repeat protein [Blastocatellia bacterium]